MTLNVALVKPASTVTFTGVCAAPTWLLDRVTSVPLAGAAALRVTVPVTLVPPVTLVCAKVNDASTGGLTVRTAERETPKVAVIFAGVELPTGLVLTLNTAVVAPPATVTLVGVCAAALSLERVTTAPTAGAAPFKVTVPDDGLPPVRLVGLRTTEVRVGGLMVKVVVWAVP